MSTISPLVRDLLIEHIPGPVSIGAQYKGTTFGEIRSRGKRLQLIRMAIDLGWIEYDYQILPKHTILTVKGRRLLSAALSEWADCLRRAGFRFDATPDFMKDRETLESDSHAIIS